MNKTTTFLIGVCLTLCCGQASARVSADEAAKLDGPDLTCLGAEKAGTESGIAEYVGKWYKKWDDSLPDHGYVPSPYDDEAPLFTITGSNYEKYKENLTAGQIEMFKKYPQSFKMKVFQSHRDFKFVDWTCGLAKKNALEAEVIDNGLGLSGHSGIHPFPLPQSGFEAIWNVIKPHRAYTESVIHDTADVYENGAVSWGKSDFKTMNPGNHPTERRGLDIPVDGYFFVKTILPSRAAGEVAVGFQPNNYSEETTQAWQYNPGIRRVRKAPEVGFDYPVPPAGLRTVDDDYIFNGSPERYNWKLIGKKEIYVPYHANKVNDPAIKYSQLTTANTLNPDYTRYELHRMWVIEAELKEGVRHIYKKRRIYADEDSWLAYMSESYDNQDHLWRVNWVHYFYSQESGTFHRTVSLYHNLTSGAYEATYLSNESSRWWRLDQPMEIRDFTPSAALRAGQ